MPRGRRRPPEGSPPSCRAGQRRPNRPRPDRADPDRADPDRADEAADALAGGILTDGPILLVPSCGDLPAVVAGEISRLDPQRVIALGGTGAICDDLLTQAGNA